MSKPNTPAKAVESAEDVSWRSFPTLEKVFSSDLEGFYARVQETCGELNAIIEGSENPREAARARSAMAAYGKTLELFHEIQSEMDKAGAR
ncbi:MAG: hypothetical protein GC160_00375 [Acidobacteria bacterium]|nr:hypothetical protein [Acidobacteriota bacterium]